ncbi:response regulator transcription factor [Caenimonas sp. DR4.4]|uniref:Response regulator transcription factor n=1 Tax=Caenimonas aquaedulcis TaxID=2793270 RepID=A0A931H8G0_9BURK|nr:response regulator transcription factor [Caenimonas aquaedulcis]MBG9390536.1 response regulator transcription factor [Caenimonas aquaedulcis]
MIRVGIADDHSIVRTGLRAYLHEHGDMDVVGEAGDGNATMDLTRVVPMDVLVLDLEMPGKGGLDMIRTIRTRTPDVGVLVFSGYPAANYAVNVMRLGARGFLSKLCEPRDVVEAIRRVAAGHAYLSPDVADMLAYDMGRTVRRKPHESLSNREFQLLLHMGRGRTSAEIADALSLSCKTVSTYRSQVLKKLEIRTNSEMTLYCVSNGLLD